MTRDIIRHHPRQVTFICTLKSASNHRALHCSQHSKTLGGANRKLVELYLWEAGLGGERGTLCDVSSGQEVYILLDVSEYKGPRVRQYHGSYR